MQNSAHALLNECDALNPRQIYRKGMCVRSALLALDVQRAIVVDVMWSGWTHTEMLFI